MDNFITRTLRIMKDRGLSGADMARMTGLSASVFSNWSTGNTLRPQTKTRQRIAQSLGVSEHYLSYGDKPAGETKAPEKIEPVKLVMPAGDGNIAVIVCPPAALNQVLAQIGR